MYFKSLKRLFIKICFFFIMPVESEGNETNEMYTADSISSILVVVEALKCSKTILTMLVSKDTLNWLLMKASAFSEIWQTRP